MGLYATPEVYAANRRPGVLPFLSPKLFRPQHFGSEKGWPSWCGGGGGAELVSEEEARAAIRRGSKSSSTTAGRLQNLADLRVDRTPADKGFWCPVVLTYRQAAMFVTYLRESDSMMNAIFDGRTFAQAVTIGYHGNVR